DYYCMLYMGSGISVF
nr:immunoglobulin light chain junction region [Macaca mulatta]MOW56631.1 immunoglobulin light chain junction region [Macaca mulatta]MOW56742.1 immunoglobulin light chain junction region [Macaca mulatta]MOW56908.1 immunoglobulin light chain junction region [Macaca mulatta]MOW56953.1 immunoglobulin light chain junction region [Macaca mulatta]